MTQVAPNSGARISLPPQPAASERKTMMMQRLSVLLCTILIIGTGGSYAAPLVSRPDPAPPLRLAATACFGGRTTPTEDHPILDRKRISAMRRAGQLPDTFVCGRCRYDIGGDPGAVYYVKTCS